MTMILWILHTVTIIYPLKYITDNGTFMYISDNKFDFPIKYA